jgi:hypothetical protein
LVLYRRLELITTFHLVKEKKERKQNKNKNNIVDTGTIFLCGLIEFHMTAMAQAVQMVI